MANNKSNWKGDERRVARMFGTQRTSLSGGNSKITRADTMHERLFIEVKKRERHSVVELWKKTRVLAKRENKIPVVVLRSGNSKHTIVVVEISDLQAIKDEIVEEFRVNLSRRPAKRIE